MSLFLLWLALATLPAQPERPATSTAKLLPGLGNTHHEIATGSAEAQKFFDQGLTLVYGFNHDEAIRSFRRAAELAPASPMPLWGIALALGPNINLDVDPAREQEAFETAQQASRVAARASASERAYVAALVRRYSSDPRADLKALAMAYADAMRDLSAQYPDDLDAATLYGQQIAPALTEAPMLQPFAAKPLYVWLRFAKWDNVLALLQPDPKMGILTVLWHFGRGVAFAQKGQTADAQRERAAFREAGRTLPPETPWNYNSAGDMLKVMDAVLDGRIALASGDASGAVDGFTRAVAAEDSLSYDEPPDWYYPVRESLGAALLGASRLAEAERVFREDLQRNPRNGRSLFGLWQTLVQRGNESAAALIETEFKEAWKHAEVQLKLADY